MVFSSPLSQRLGRGQELFSSMLLYWIKSSDLSLRQFCKVGQWATGESTWISSGPLSHMTRGCVQKVSIRYLDMFATANYAIWAWHNKGKELALREFGPCKQWGVEPPWLDRAIWLHNPNDHDDFLDVGDFARVYAGKLEIPYVSVMLSEGEGKMMSRELTTLLNNLVRDLGLPPRESLEVLLRAHPEPNDRKRGLISLLLLGDGEVNTRELREELDGLAIMVGNVRGLSKGSYGSADLRAELLSGRYRV